jgi:hypothetical protein
MQVAWLRSFAISDRASQGTLALVETRPSAIDVYAVGLYEGSRTHSRFETGRIGAVTVVIARDDGCADVKDGTECESTLRFYLPAYGRLNAAAATPAQRVRNFAMREVGRVRARLTTEPPVFDAQSIRIKEKLSIRDSGDDEVRRTEGERVFQLRGAELVAIDDSVAQRDLP